MSAPELNRVIIDNVPEARVDEIMDVLGAFSVDHGLSISVRPGNNSSHETADNPGGYNPALVSYLNVKGLPIPVLPVHKLDAYAKTNLHTKILRPARYGSSVFDIGRLQENIREIHKMGHRFPSPDELYTFSRILRADTLDRLLADIHDNPERFPFREHEIEFLEACAADLQAQD